MPKQKTERICKNQGQVRKMSKNKDLRFNKDARDDSDECFENKRISDIFEEYHKNL